MSFLTRFCKQPTPEERLDEYNAHFHKFDEEHLRRVANGIAAKRRMLAEIRNRETQKRLRVEGVQVKVKQKLRLAR